MFRLAAAVEEWPSRLPHYRFVRILAQNAETRTVEMAARRDVFKRIGVPLHWVAEETLYPETNRIVFRHIAGITRGMWVEWSIEPARGGLEQSWVQIRHVFRPGWPVPDALIQAIVGEYFVNGVARRTLAYLGEQAQRTS